MITNYISIFILILGFFENNFEYVNGDGDKKYNIDNPSLNPDINLDRSKKLREGLFEPCEMGIIKNDILRIMNTNTSSINNLLIKGLDLYDSNIRRGESILSNNNILLYRPYEGVFVNYNITNFSKFISRIVEMEIEMHLIFGPNNKRLLIRKREINDENNNKSQLFNEYQNINFLIVAGYFPNDINDTSKYLLRDFMPVFQDNVTLSRQNMNQYYARYGITSFKDRLTVMKQDIETNNRRLFVNNKINIDKHKLSFLYLPHNDTQLYFSSNGNNIVLPKLHLKAIQTHEEARNEPNDSFSDDEQYGSKKMVIVILLLITMFTSFMILFYILISWYLKGIEDKNS